MEVQPQTASTEAESTESLAAAKVPAFRRDKLSIPDRKLLKAVRQGDIHEAGRALELRADINVRSSRGKTPLHLAVERRLSGMVEYLLLDADTDLLDDFGCSALDKVTPEDSRIHKLLTKRGARSTFVGGAEVDLLEAAHNGDLEGVQEALEAGANIEARDHFGASPLHCAVAFRHPRVVEFLLHRGANVHARENLGQTPLHLAHTAEIARLLIDAGADVNAVSRKGDVPLHSAAHVQESHEVTRVLLECGATGVNKKNRDGLTPLDCAEILHFPSEGVLRSISDASESE